MSSYSFYNNFKERKDLYEYGPNALSLYALQLILNIEDIASITADAIVDGSDDKGIDLIHIDRERGIVVIAQSYENKNSKKLSAPSKKAGYLSHSISVLLQSDLKVVPERLRPSAAELREALSKGEIEKFYIWFIHNLPGSKNVKNELNAVEKTAKAILKEYEVIKEIKSQEISADLLEQKYKSISTTINVTEKFTILIPDGMAMKGDNWDAYVTSVRADWLHEQFKKHGTEMFSANVRDYLGISKKTDKNINNGIKETVENEPSRFWVYNNGVTILVDKFNLSKDKKKLIFNGLSILNGAQTTGAIGNAKSLGNNNAMVQARFVMCTDPKTVELIKRYNNSQNKIEAPDFKSSDSNQERLIEEFKRSSDIVYSPRRGSAVDIVKRKLNSLQSVLAGQVLAAFHGDPDVAYHQKTRLWEDDSLYLKYFNESTSAKHIVFAYSLFEALRKKKQELHKKSKSNSLKDIEKDQYEFFQERGSIFLFLAGISNSLELILNASITSRFRIEFKKNLKIAEAIDAWSPIIDAACFLVSKLRKGFTDGSVSKENATNAIKDFTAIMGATAQGNKKIYSEFARLVEIRNI